MASYWELRRRRSGVATKHHMHHNAAENGDVKLLVSDLRQGSVGMLDRRVVSGQQNGGGDEETSSVQFRHLQVDPVGYLLISVWRTLFFFFFRKAESRIEYIECSTLNPSRLRHPSLTHGHDICQCSYITMSPVTLGTLK